MGKNLPFELRSESEIVSIPSQRIWACASMDRFIETEENSYFKKKVIGLIFVTDLLLQ